MAEIKGIGMSLLFTVVLLSGRIVAQDIPTVFLFEIVIARVERSELEKMGLKQERREAGLIPLGKERNWNEIIQKLHSEKKAEFLSNPHLSLLQGKKEEVVIGEPLRYLEKEEEGLYRLKTVEGQINGTQMEVTAKELTDEKVMLSVKYSMTNVFTYQPLPGAEEFKAGMPLTQVRDFSTNMILEEGQTQVFAGLITNGTAEIYFITIKKPPPPERWDK